MTKEKKDWWEMLQERRREEERIRVVAAVIFVAFLGIAAVASILACILLAFEVASRF